MSSVEIAEVTGKNHADVMRDIRTVLGQAEIDASRFAGVYLGGNGQERPCYHLPRLECDLVVSGYSVPYRLAIIKRWHELEAKEAAPATLALPQTYPQALRALADMAEKREQQERQLQLQTRELAAKDEQLEGQQPKVEAFDDLMNAEGLYGVRDTAKAPGRTLTSFARSHESHCVLRVFAPVSPHSHETPPPLTRGGGVLVFG